MGLAKVEKIKDQRRESLVVVYFQDQDTYLVLESTSDPAQVKVIKSKVCNRVSDDLNVAKLNPFMRSLNQKADGMVQVHPYFSNLLYSGTDLYFIKDNGIQQIKKISKEDLLQKFGIKWNDNNIFNG